MEYGLPLPLPFSHVLASSTDITQLVVLPVVKNLTDYLIDRTALPVRLFYHVDLPV